MDYIVVRGLTKSLMTKICERMICYILIFTDVNGSKAAGYDVARNSLGLGRTKNKTFKRGPITVTSNRFS